jgi:hypothetical protein
MARYQSSIMLGSSKQRGVESMNDKREENPGSVEKRKKEKDRSSRRRSGLIIMLMRGCPVAGLFPCLSVHNHPCSRPGLLSFGWQPLPPQVGGAGGL